MTRRGDGGTNDVRSARGAFLAEFGRTAGEVRGFRLFTDRLELRLHRQGRSRRRILPLARIAHAQAFGSGGGAVLRLGRRSGHLDVEMLSLWEATLAAELISGLQEIASAQAGSGEG